MVKTYVDIRCPYCNQMIVCHERSDFYDYNRMIGPSLNRCPNCKKIYRTGLKLYSDMNKYEKNIVKFDAIRSAAITAISIFFVLFAIACAITAAVNSDIIKHIGVFIMLGSAVVSLPIGIVVGIREYKEIKEQTVDDFELDEELKAILKGASTNGNIVSKPENPPKRTLEKLDIEKLYKQLSKDTEEVCQIIVKNGFENEFLAKQDYNVILVFYNLMAILYVKIKNKKSREEAENTIKGLIYETLLRMPDEYAENLYNAASDTVTMAMSLSKTTGDSYILERTAKEFGTSIEEIAEMFDFSTGMAKNICEIFAEDKVMYLKNDKYKVLINELKGYFDIKAEEYNRLVEE